MLDDQERIISARKCIRLIREAGVVGKMSERNRQFFVEQETRAGRLGFTSSEPQLQWLRDLVEKHVTN